MVHGHQKIRDRPRGLLDRIPGVWLADLTEADWCCGSAEIQRGSARAWPIVNPRLVMYSGLASRAGVVVTATARGIIQIAQGLRAGGARVRVFHLAAAYGRLGA